MALLEEFERQGQYLFKHRGALPLLIITIGIAAFWDSVYSSFWLSNPWLDRPYEIGCLSVSVLGIIIRSIAVGYSQKNTSGRNTTKQIADSVNKTGLYSVVRHPLYLANFCMWLGVALLTRNAWFILFFVILFWVYYERIMFAEEQFLRRKFGEVYEAWAAKTPAFVPKLQQWRSSGTTFNVKKVMLQEKNGVLATSILFLLFEEMEQFVKNGSLLLQENIWYFIFLATLLFYLIVKFISKRTLLLR